LKYCGLFETQHWYHWYFFASFQEDIIDPAIKGTLNVLASCAKVPTIKRVVLSSSSAAALYNGRPLTPETVVDETWFSTKEGCEASYGVRIHTDALRFYAFCSL